MKKRIYALALALLVLLALTASGAFLALEAGHDCGEADCPICAALAQCSRLSRLLCFTLCAVYLAACAPAVLRRVHSVPLSGVSVTPVSLKVLLLN